MNINDKIRYKLMIKLMSEGGLAFKVNLGWLFNQIIELFILQF